jgi:hypothetical protein
MKTRVWLTIYTLLAIILACGWAVSGELPEPTFEDPNEIICEFSKTDTCGALFLDVTGPHLHCKMLAVGYVEGVFDIAVGLLFAQPNIPSLTNGDIVNTWLTFYQTTTIERFDMMLPQYCVAGSFYEKWGEPVFSPREDELYEEGSNGEVR